MEGGWKTPPPRVSSRAKSPGLIGLIARELTGLNLVRVQTTAWIRFTQDDDRVELSFNNRMTDVH